MLISSSFPKSGCGSRVNGNVTQKSRRGVSLDKGFPGGNGDIFSDRTARVKNSSAENVNACKALAQQIL